MTKSAMATPGRVDLAVSTVKIDGSYGKIGRLDFRSALAIKKLTKCSLSLCFALKLTAWSKATQFITMKSFRLYLYGV